MKVKYLLDENVDLEYRFQLIRHSRTMTVWAVNDPGAPAKETPDPDILRWCEEHNFILLTNNRRSMPRHLADHLADGQCFFPRSDFRRRSIVALFTQGL